MAMLSRQALDDRNVRPTDEVVHAHLGEAAASWDALWPRVDEALPQLHREWRYYRDGGWLLKVIHGSRTICWVSVGEGGFRLTAYLPPRAEAAVADSRLPDHLKREFLQNPATRTRAVTVAFPEDPDTGAGLDAVVALLTLRDGFR